MRLQYRYFLNFFCIMISDCLRNIFQIRQGGEERKWERANLNSGRKAITGGAEEEPGKKGG